MILRHLESNKTKNNTHSKHLLPMQEHCPNHINTTVVPIRGNYNKDHMEDHTIILTTICNSKINNTTTFFICSNHTHVLITKYQPNPLVGQLCESRKPPPNKTTQT